MTDAVQQMAEGVRRHTLTAAAAAVGGALAGLAVGLVACAVLTLPTCLRVAAGLAAG